MANKKVSQLTSKPSVLTTDLFPIADPTTGQLYKTTISDLGTAIGSGVSSVNGLVGAVVLDTDDIQELVSPTNKWFTDTRARAALSASSPLTYNSGTGVFGIQVANGSQNGYLSSADWTTFNSKQDALINPITGSGTTNYIPKFTAASVLGDSNIQDSGSLITLGSNSYVNGSLGIGSTSLTGYNLRVSKNITGSTTAYGIYLDSTIQSDVTNIGYMFMSAPSIASSFAANSVHHFRANPVTLNSGSSISTQVGYMVSSAFTNAAANFAFRSDMPATSGSFNLYMVGTANNYLAGSLGIGSTALTGYNLRVSKNITGATTAYGIYQDSTVQSDVTTSAYYNRTSANTVASAFTLGTLAHYTASQGTFGAGSTVTNQYGFLVDNSFTGATNNYGFYGNVSSGTNRWNLYMQGSANNYIAGNLGIGSTSPSGKLEVNLVGGAAYFTRVAGDNGTTNPALQISTSTSSPRFYAYGLGMEFYTAAVGGTGTIKMILTSSGELGIGTSTVNASALLQVDSTTKGVLFPRMTTTQKNAISSPATGLVVFDTDLGKLCVFSTTWQTITSV